MYLFPPTQFVKTHSIKFTFILCLLSMFVIFNNITSNTFIFAEEFTSVKKKFLDFDDNKDLLTASHTYLILFVETALVCSLFYTLKNATSHVKNTLPIRAPPVFQSILLSIS